MAPQRELTRPLLHVDGLTVTYGPTEVVRDVGFSSTAVAASR